MGSSFANVFKLVLTLSLVSGSAWAKLKTHKTEPTASPPPTAPAVLTGPATFVVNPENLRVRLLDSNLSLIQQLNQVRDAKLQVSVSKDALLPSLNLSALSGAGGPSFLLSSVQFLMPFLLPSNWGNYHAQKNTFVADEYSYQIMQLNTYSSALSLYMTVIAQENLQKVYEQEYEDLKKVYDTEMELVKLGTISANDLLPAESQSNLAGTLASQLAQQVDQMTSSLRQILGLPLSTTITYDIVSMPASDWETKPVQDVVNQASLVAPEHLQIQYLVKAAKSKKFSTMFSWISNATLSSQGNSTSGSMSGLAAVGSVNLGFGLIPEIRLASNNIQETALLETQFEESNTQIVEGSMKGVQEGLSQMDQSLKSQNEMDQAYATKKEEFNLGFISLTDLLIASTQEVQSEVARINAQLNLDLQRVVIHRALVTDQFAAIKGCGLTVVPEDAKNTSLEQLCQAHGVAQPQ